MKQELSSRARIVALLGLVALSFPLSSCGDDSGAESIFLYVINGYAGSNGLTLIGPAGTISSNLAFGDRVGPVEVNRALGTDFTVLLDGTPQAIELQLELFAMYPQETGTLFLKRRSDNAEVDVSVFRHVQTISDGCSLVFNNGLSLSNTYAADNEFAFSPQFRIEDPLLHGYFDESQIQVPTECGPLPTPPPASIVRDRTARDADPYYYFTDCGENSRCPHWGRLLATGSVAGPLGTAEYIACVSAAITIKQPVVDPPLPFPPEDAQAQCPPGELTWNDVQFDLPAIQECQLDVARPADLFQPGEVGARLDLIYYLQPEYCDATFRIRSPGLETIFGPKAGEPLGSHLDGDFVESRVNIPRGSQHFYVLFGRPVNPLIWQWDSGGAFVNLARYPYFNDQNGNIGDYDYPE